MLDYVLYFKELSESSQDISEPKAASNSKSYDSKESTDELSHNGANDSMGSPK